MNNEELKEALINRRPIIARSPLMGEIEYAYVSAIIYKRNERGGVYVIAELIDKCGRSVTVTDPKYLKYKEDHE